MKGTNGKMIFIWKPAVILVRISAAICRFGSGVRVRAVIESLCARVIVFYVLFAIYMYIRNHAAPRAGA